MSFEDDVIPHSRAKSNAALGAEATPPPLGSGSAYGNSFDNGKNKKS